MRLGLIVIILGCSAQLLLANSTNAQTIDATTIAVDVRNQPLLAVFKQIESQTAFRFAYNKSQLTAIAPVTFQSKNANLRTVMERLLSKTGLSFRQINNKILIYQLHANAEPPAEEPAFPEITGEQDQVLRFQGRVIDDRSGDPVIGATVAVKGKTQGAVTNTKGEFIIDAAPGTVIIISSLGFEKKEITLAANSQRLTVRLGVSAQTLTDVVVTGLYNRPAQNFTGAATILTREKLGKVTNNNVLAAISTLDPSFQIPENITNGANPNTLPNVQLRGGNSIANPAANTSDVLGYSNKNVNTPLFILDGFEVPLQRIFDLDINRISKVTILKDAAATSIYGSRAANGVVILELMAPQEGKLRVTVNSNMTIETPDLRDYDLLNAQEKLDLELKGGIYKSNINQEQERLNVLYATRLAQVQSGVNTYWLSKPVRTGVGTKHNVYIEGGGNNALYGVSLTYDKRNGVMKGSDRENIQASSYLSYRLKNFQFRNEVTLGFNKANNSPYGTFDQYTVLNPYWNPYDANGNAKYYLENLRYANGQVGNNGDLLTGQIVNPLYNGSLAVVDQNRYKSLMNNLNAIWQAASWLRFNARLSFQQQSDYYDKFLPPTHTDFASLLADEYAKRGSYSRTDGDSRLLDGNFTADVNKTLGKSVFFGTLGMNFQDQKNEATTLEATGFPNERLNRFFNAIQYKSDSKPMGMESRSRLAGYLANLSYAYDNRYLLDVSYRLDGSSLFGSEKRFANFWSLGGGWNLHKEKFWASNPNINLLKLRYSFGYTGSQRFASYLAITTGQYYQVPYNGQYGLYLLGYGNPDLAWQQTQKHNWGTDITLFNKLNISANYFIEKTQGALATVNTAPSTGFNSYQENLGDLTNKGWEAYINYTILSNKRNNINVFLNLFSSEGKYTRISNSLQELNKRADTSKSTVPLVRYAEGMSPTAIWAVRSKGIDPSNGREIFITRDGKETNTYSTADQVVVGDSRAKIEGTFGMNYELKGIGFNAYFRFRMGGQTYNQTLADRVENVDLKQNVDRRVYTQRWQKPGDHTFFKGVVDEEGYTVNAGPTYPTSRFVQDYSYLSAESLSLYYRFSDTFNKRYGVSNTKISVFTGQLFRFSTVKQERGLAYPYSQTFTFLFQTSF